MDALPQRERKLRRRQPRRPPVPQHRFNPDEPCKNEGCAEVGMYGECLRCGADQGEVCRS